MTEAYWERLQSLFDAASELPLDRQKSFLDQHCAGNYHLRQQIESLLSASGSSEEFFQETVSSAAEILLNQEESGEIGPYAIVRRLGEGGMGDVYLAVRADDHYSKQVAIKLVKTGQTGANALRRFRAERQILANLDHPGIAGLLDGGSTVAGIPYVVMEYVDGIPIDDYCRTHKLSTPAKLLLFLEVCSAVAYAHRNLVVHRDIKPGNILVTSEGVAKLLDFGIAKLLHPTGRFGLEETRATQRLMTPEYASPEQVRGDPITTAVDVYSLGILLYELLTGVRPYQLDNLRPAEFERVICETTPARPSTVGDGLRRELAGDLDSIILKALRKEPARRYASVEQFSEDLQRHLKGLPVQARPDTFFYRAAKFSRRHALGLGALVAFILILIGGMVSTSLAQKRAEAAQVRSQRRFQNILAMANSSLFEIHDSVAELPGSTRTRALVVSRTLQYLNMLSTDSASEPALLRELASAYEKLADIQFRDGPGHLGDSKGAWSSARQALALRQQILTLEPADQGSRLAEAADTLRIADIQRLTRQGLNALPHYQNALRLYQQMAAEKPADRQLRERIAETQQRYGDALRSTGDLAASQNQIESSVSILKALLQDTPSNPETRRAYEQACMVLGDLQREQLGNFKAAAETLQVSLGLARGLRDEFPRLPAYKTDLASILSRLGNVYYGSGDMSMAILFYRESLSIIKSMAEADPGDGRARRSVAIHSTNLAQALDRVGQNKEAEDLFVRSIAIQLQLMKEDPESIQHQNDLGYVRHMLGELLLRTGRLADAETQLQAALEVRRAVVNRDRKNVEYQFRLARTNATLGDLRRKLGRGGEACESYRSSEKLLATLEGKISLQGEPKRVAKLLAACP